MACTALQLPKAQCVAPEQPSTLSSRQLTGSTGACAPLGAGQRQRAHRHRQFAARPPSGALG